MTSTPHLLPTGTRVATREGTGTVVAGSMWTWTWNDVEHGHDPGDRVVAMDGTKIIRTFERYLMTPVIDAAEYDRADDDQARVLGWCVLPALLAAIVVVVLAVAGVIPSAWAPSAPLSAPQTVSEDSPQWDCRTMGNRLCGPGAVGGPLSAPGPDGLIVCPDERGTVFDPETRDGVIVCSYRP